MEAYKYILIVLVGFLSISAKAQDKSYLAHEVYLAPQEASIPQLLEAASQQCGCYFSYPSDLFSEENIRMRQAFKGSLADFITTILDSNITFSCYKNQIILQESKHETPQDTTFNYLQISAVIVDSSTMKAIPYASVLLEGSMLGTSANAEGQFRLKLNENLKDHRIQVSCLGYFSRYYSVQALQAAPQIYLSPANYSLQEVVVRSVGSQYIVDKAVANLKTHYRQEAYNYTSFYREIAYRNKEQLSYIEALFQAYSPKNKGMRQDDLVLQKARKFTPAPSQQDSIILKLKGGTEAALSLDIARYPTDFLDENRDQLYRYQIVDMEMWKEQLVYVLAFSPRNEKSSAQFQGELYISFEDYILLGADFQYTQQMLHELRHKLVIKKERRTKVLPQQYNYHIEYQSYHGLYHLNYIRGDIVIKAKDKSSWLYKNFNTVFEMVVTEMILSDEKRTKSIPKYKTNSVFSEAVEFSPIEFWLHENVIIPEHEIMDAFQKSGFMLEEEE